MVVVVVVVEVAVVLVVLVVLGVLVVLTITSHTQKQNLFHTPPPTFMVSQGPLICMVLKGVGGQRLQVQWLG